MDQKRFILAMVLSAGVILVWQILFGPEPPSPDQQSQKAEKTAQPTPDGGDDESAPPSDQTGQTAQTGKADPSGPAEDDQTDQSADDTSDGRATASAENGDNIGEPVVDRAERERDVETVSHVLETDRVRVEVSNAYGGRVTSAVIRAPEQYAHRGNLLDEFPDKASHYPFRVGFAENSIPVPSDATYKFVEDRSDQASGGDTYNKVTYRYTDPQGRFHIDKIFRVPDDDPYTLEMDVQIANKLEDAKLSDQMVVDIFGYRDPDEETSMLNFRPNQVQGACRTPDEVKRASITGIEEALQYGGSEIAWGAIDTRYFMMAAIPDDPAQSCGLQKVDKGFMRTRITEQSFSARPGETINSEYKLYLGPKDLDLLHNVHSTLGESVDFGLFSFFARPLHWGLTSIHKYVGNWGVAILILTLLIKLVTWPINMKAYRNMNEMKKIQPKLEDIRDKYEDDRQKMTEETMKLFRENDVSPLGGCLPMLVQMPILYGLYIMIYYSVDLYHADFALWYTNLAAPDPYYVLPVVMGVVMFGQQSMMSGASGNTQAKIMSKVMPVMFTAFMLFLPSGLVLYYSTNLIIGLGQQFYIRDDFSLGLSDDDGEA